MTELFWLPADWIHRFPFLPLFPGLTLALYWVMKRSEIKRRESLQTAGLLVLISAALWMAFAILEGILALVERFSPPRGVPIRIDIFLVYPLLLITLPLSLFGIWRLNRTDRSES